MRFKMALYSLVCTAAILSIVDGHGRVIEPPSRVSAWRHGFNTPIDYDDNAYNCGGLAKQHSINGGKCGLCGDDYSLRIPRPSEFGGKLCRGIIVAHYHPDSTISIKVQLTTSHKGFWEFKLCPDPRNNTQECFDTHTLKLVTGETKYYPRRGNGEYYEFYRLPFGLKCAHCVLQWTYTGGNNWGYCDDGVGRLGCGPQETFRACSDVSIGLSVEKTTRTPVRIRPAKQYIQRKPVNFHRGSVYWLKRV